MGEEEIKSVQKPKRYAKNEVVSIWIVMLILFFGSIILNKIFQIPFFKGQPTIQVVTGSDITTWPILAFSWSTPDVSIDTWYIWTWTEDLTWADIEISDIDKVYGILETWKPGEDYSIINPKPQYIKYSATVGDSFNTYLASNMFFVTMPKDTKSWYLYIKLHKPLKYMPNTDTYQPMTIKTNIYVNKYWIYWRLNTKASLGTYIKNQEFLYKLSDVPVQTAKHSTTSWLLMAWKKIQIGWFVSDTNWNYIEKIIFIREK